MGSITFSVIIPTYNSEKTLRFTLESIKMQKYDLSRVECLVIDGGSSDLTLKIAGEYDFVRILNNQKRLPEYAKLVGFRAARGRYIIKMDSDEAFLSEDIFDLREKAFEQFREAHLLVADIEKYVPVSKKEIAGNYLNACGDPFSFFIYRPKKSILDTFQNNTAVSSENGICLLKFSGNDKRPIADGGTTVFDREYLLDRFPDKMDDISFVCSFSDKILDDMGNCLCIKDDTVLHRSRSDLKSYLSKIRFRIINNIFHKEESGFSSRKVSSGKKKYLFPLYTFSFVLPLIDAAKLAKEYGDFRMLMHIFYCYYTCFYIFWYLLLSLLKINKFNTEY